jgi:fucose permease
VYGAIGIFVYVGAEVAIGSDIANYLALPNIGHFSANIADPAAQYHSALAVAARYISLYWLGAMFGRFIGSAVLHGVRTLQVGMSLLVSAVVLAISYATGPVAAPGSLGTVLAFLYQIRPLIILCTVSFLLLTVLSLRTGRIGLKTSNMLALASASAALLVTLSVFTEGHLAMWSILLVGYFNSIMFPSIFTSGIAELGPLTGDGSGILNMAIVGGAIIPYLVGKIALMINRSYYPSMTQGETSWGQGIHWALIIAAVCYLYILFYAVSGSRPNSERYGSSGAHS